MSQSYNLHYNKLNKIEKISYNNKKILFHSFNYNKRTSLLHSVKRCEYYYKSSSSKFISTNKNISFQYNEKGQIKSYVQKYNNLLTDSTILTYNKNNIVVKQTYDCYNNLSKKEKFSYDSINNPLYSKQLAILSLLEFDIKHFNVINKNNIKKYQKYNNENTLTETYDFSYIYKDSIIIQTQIQKIGFTSFIRRFTYKKNNSFGSAIKKHYALKN